MSVVRKRQNVQLFWAEGFCELMNTGWLSKLWPCCRCCCNNFWSSACKVGKALRVTFLQRRNWARWRIRCWILFQPSWKSLFGWGCNWYIKMVIIISLCLMLTFAECTETLKNLLLGRYFRFWLPIDIWVSFFDHTKVFNHYNVAIVMDTWYTFYAFEAVWKHKVEPFNLGFWWELFYDNFIRKCGFDINFILVEVKKLYFDFGS